LGGGEGNDLLLGNQDASNSLDSNADNDVVIGCGQYDLINGGQGADYLVGGAGNDTYVYSTADFGTDLIDDGVVQLSTTKYIAACALNAWASGLFGTQKRSKTTGRAMHRQRVVRNALCSAN
jgi:Ca2+-binding RTX toxin-like protein